jgi:hypothetical protein
VQWVDRRCPRDQFCVGDRCRALACRPGERRCKDRSTLVVCSALGVPSEQRCACQNGACKPEFSVEVTFVELSVTLAQDKGGPPTKDPRIVKAEVACEVDGKAALKRGFPLREGTVKLGTSASFDMAKRARFTLTCRLEAKGAVPGKPYRAAHTIQALGTRTRWLSLRLLSNRLNAPVATANLAYQLRVVRNR